MGKLFGTDGIRGIANKKLTPELAYNVGRAAAFRLRGQDKDSFVIGMDTRKSCNMLGAALASGITSVGLNVLWLGAMPTPAVAFLTRHFNAVAGVVISASHNPAEYNGIKFFGEEGYKLPDDVEDEIESYIFAIDSIDARPIGGEIGEIRSVERAERIYIDYLKEIVPMDLSSYKICLDTANGATYHVTPEVFRELGADVRVISDEPDGVNINKKCGSTRPEEIQDFVLREGADVGFAYDGDGDRLITVDEKGRVMDGDHALAAIAMYMKKKGTLKNDTIVGTVMTNIGLFKYLEEIDVNLETTKVGDRYVLERMLGKDYIVGGEQSGHIIFLEENTTGDGSLTSLKLMEIAHETGMKFSELNDLMFSYPQVLVNARVDDQKKHKYEDDPEIMEAIDELNETFHGEGRVLIRPSGTEPLVRVMIEGKDYDFMVEKANDLADLIEKKLN